jgi:hypothetical protein
LRRLRFQLRAARRVRAGLSSRLAQREEGLSNVHEDTCVHPRIRGMKDVPRAPL